MLRLLAPILAVLLVLAGCHAPTPKKTASIPPPPTPAPAAPPAPATPELAQLYRTQLERLVGVAWNQSGTLPKEIEPIEAQVIWRPLGQTSTFAHTLTASSVSTLKPDEVGYVWTSDRSAAFWFGTSDLNGERGLGSEPLTGAGMLKTTDKDLAGANPDAAALIKAATFKEEKLERDLLLTKSPPAAANAAAANLALRDLLAWKLNHADGKWPSSASDIPEATLALVGSTPGLDVWIDAPAKLMYAQFTVAGAPPHLAVIKAIQTNQGEWITIANAAREGKTVPPGIWKVM